MPKAAVHKEKLIETAMRLFRRQGYASVGLQEILKESGAPKGSLYYYFPEGKEALGEAAVRLAGARKLELLTTLAQKHKNSKTYIKAYCGQMAEWMAESDFHSGSPITTTVLETVPKSKRIQTASQEVMAEWLAVHKQVFLSSGFKNAEAARLAITLEAALDGALVQSRIQQSATPIKQIATVLGLLAVLGTVAL